MTPRMLGWVFGMAAAFAVIYYSLPKKAGPADQNGSKTVTSTVNRSQCESRLAKWIQSVDPVRHQFDTDLEGRGAELNRYWETCGPTGTDPIVTDLKPFEAALAGEAKELALAKRFSRRDVQHIRQSILLARMARRIAEGRETDRERAKAAMTLIAQQVDPLPLSTAADRPLTPFEALLIGRGTAADRAWIFAEILRQIRVDVVVFLHADPKVSPLLGVLGASEILLFDPLTGFPVPAAGEKDRPGLFQEPARLADTVADDSILRQLDIEGSAFPWTADSLKAATVGVVGTSCTWSPRMAELQFQWPSGEACVLFDGLGPNVGLERGLLLRAQEAVGPLGYAADRVQVWSYPEERAAQYQSLGGETSPHMQSYVEIMSGPIVVENDFVNGARTVKTYRSKRPLQLVRAQQLIGDVSAIEGYLPLTRAHIPPRNTSISADIQQVLDKNRVVADWATYWKASTQFENKDISACAGTLRLYRRDFALGEMTEAALMRLAACLASVRDNQNALDVLKAIGPGPNQWRRGLLIRRIEQILAQSPAATPPAAGAETTPAQDAPKPESPSVPPAPQEATPLPEK